MKHTATMLLACLATVLLTPHTVFCAEIFAGRLYTVPENIYVEQLFEIRFELEVTAGIEIEDLRISDFPNNPDLITVGRLEALSRQRVVRDGQAFDVLRYAATARCRQAVAHTFNPTAQCMLSERRNVGFFSHWQSHPRQHRLAPFTLKVLPLPEQGKPENFSGAVGIFRLVGNLSKNSVRPGDIVTLSLELTGQGWLNNTSMPQPPASPHFKSYPVKETSRSDMRVTTEQSLIPQSTNATEIAAVSFNFFNPGSGRYEESTAGPFRLTFNTSAPQAQTSVRVIDTSSAPDHAAPDIIPLERLQVSLDSLTPILIALGGTMIAFFGFFLLRTSHPRWAAMLGAAVLAAGLFTAKGFKDRQAGTHYRIEHSTEARFAPAHSAATLFTLNPGAAVAPLERHEGWVRVDSNGRRGWVPQASCSTSNNPAL
ncbi:MAG: SH3 domain-containing protein [Kiritimatiellae bacterium]|nr:SH3 domain-containing protein [Kiritimatiellia bacterium]